MATVLKLEKTFAAASNKIVRAHNVEKSFHLGATKVEALRGVSLEVERGEMLALCGTSGSGKTTLLNLIGCLDSTTSGDIYIDDKKVGDMTDNEVSAFRATQLGFIFQTFNLIPVLSALENVEYPLLLTKMSRRERKERALEALKQVGLEHHADHRPDQLSGGQRQRVAIARAIVHRPSLIIADEPTANLDKKTAAEILDLLADLNSKLGVTIIIATHDPNVMKRVRRLVWISDGGLMEAVSGQEYVREMHA